ncbi:MAG: Uma2 family endonuclease [Chloroflexota bacterium]
MTVLTQAPIPTKVKPAARPPFPVWRLTIDQYHAMIQTGILTDDDPVELLDGWLIPKMPKNPFHRTITYLLRQALERLVPAGWYVDSQEPLTLADGEPEPDVMVVRGDTRRYLNRHPGPPDVALVVEVADTTLQRDRTLKKRLYALSGIAVYWIVNLVDGQVEVYSQPGGPAGPADYQQSRVYRPPEALPIVLDGKEAGRLLVQEFLPRP